jgi:hypothetical protein
MEGDGRVALEIAWRWKEEERERLTLAGTTAFFDL